MIKILLSSIQSAVANRPDGYYDDIVSHGQIETAEVLVLPDEVYKELARKYAPQPIQPIPRKDWPLWAKGLSMIAKPEDKGIGDIVARTIGAENSEAFKKWFKATTGKDCGCTGRQARYNLQYPL